jgi:hypothetical protein
MYINKKFIKSYLRRSHGNYRRFIVCESLAITEPSWWYCITHTDDEIIAETKRLRQELKDLIDSL